MTIAEPDPNPPLEKWIGTWKHYDDSITVKQTGKAGDIQVEGMAYWPGRHDARHTGGVEASAKPERNTLVVQEGPEDFRCKLWLSLVGSLLIVNDNHKCGGMNVNFDGVYQRAK
jgi:hypothetical protein